ncbi:MAG TPA: pyridoxal phosphate-dependent aminotransferase [Gammaproteobacteria bacterium]|nr:pyridoxal phosphate-dependent aminotransferase [Gammaproteobacteria bacterium]
MTKPAHRTEKIEPFHVMRILAEARRLEAAGEDVVHMEVGEPDFATPQPIVAAGIAALEQEQTHYTPALGLPELRRAIATYYRQHLSVEVDARRIVITPGASGALQLLLALLAEKDSSVLLSDPGYPCNRNLVYLFDAIPVAIPVDAASNFQLTPEAIDTAWREDTRAVMVTTPSNPTGSLLSLQQLDSIARVVKAHGGSLIVDEIYQGLVYGQKPHSALSLGSDLYVINSFSKFFGMTGWRLGWLVAPEPMIPVLDKLAQNLYLAASTPAQHAALAAFTPETMEILQSRRREFEQRRDYLAGALEALGFSLDYRPEGAFYLYADCSGFGLDSATFSRRLLEELLVAVTPGLDFGEYRSNSYIRFAYTSNLERLKEGVRRIKGFLAA